MWTVIGEMASRYWELLGTHMSTIGALFFMSCILGALGARIRDRSRLMGIVSVLAMVPPLWWGFSKVSETASCVDDAFISFRYADNYRRGLGLIFNEGEYVEGYTNFLWTLGLAVLSDVTELQIPTMALFGCLFSWLWTIVFLFLIGQRVHGKRQFVPLAAGLYAVDTVSCAFATTGLETAACAMMVTAGVYAFVRGDSPLDRGLAGLSWILATLLRPDHALFYAVGAIVVGWEEWRSRPSAQSIPRIAAYSAPFLLWLMVAAGRIAYYGELLPNTYYAKTLPYWQVERGFEYITSFWLGNHFWLPILLLLGWCVLPTKSQSGRSLGPLKGFILLVVAAFHTYMLKVGGDFMYGRFFVSLLPLVLLGAEAFVHALGQRRYGVGVLVGALLVSTAGGVPVVPKGRKSWDLTFESSYYRLRSVDPISVRHANNEVGRFFYKVFTERGLRPVVATSGIGMVGYYSRLTLIDKLGLTDSVVARTTLRPGARIGHQRAADDEYLRERGVDFFRDPDCYQKLRIETSEMILGRVKTPRWCIFRYRRGFWNKVRRVSPEVKFPDIDVWLDAFLAGIPNAPRAETEATLAYLDTFYFRWNKDKRRRKINKALKAKAGE